MPRNPTHEKTTADEERAWTLRTRELWTQQQIADELGLDVSTISRMLARISKRVNAKLDAEAEKEKRVQLAQLEAIAADAYAEYQRSKLDGELERTVDKGQPSTKYDDELDEPVEVGSVETTREVRGRIGDAALLNQVRGALADRRKILGLDAPTKNELTGKDGAPLRAGVSLEQVVKLIRAERPAVAPGTVLEAETESDDANAA